MTGIRSCTGARLLVLTTITFAYDAREDRILAAVNLGRPEVWSCWLTRRMVLALLERAAEFVASTSALVQRASADVRNDVVAAFEREAAIARTAPAMSRAAPEVLKTTAAATELMQRVNLTHQGERFRLEFRGNAGGGADAVVLQAELQRILQMLQGEVAKAGWAVAPAPPPATPSAEQVAPKPVRH